MKRAQDMDIAAKVPVPSRDDTKEITRKMLVSDWPMVARLVQTPRGGSVPVVS
jgi:hypothetical protein